MREGGFSTQKKGKFIAWKPHKGGSYRAERGELGRRGKLFSPEFLHGKEHLKTEKGRAKGGPILGKKGGASSNEKSRQEMMRILNKKNGKSRHEGRRSRGRWRREGTALSGRNLATDGGVIPNSEGRRAPTSGGYSPLKENRLVRRSRGVRGVGLKRGSAQPRNLSREKKGLRRAEGGKEATKENNCKGKMRGRSRERREFELYLGMLNLE